MANAARQKTDVVIEVSKKDADFWREALSLRHSHDDYSDGQEIRELSAKISIAEAEYEVSIALVNSFLRDTESGPWLNAVLFADGCEQCCLPPTRDKVEGFYTFVDSIENREIIVEVKIKE